MTLPWFRMDTGFSQHPKILNLIHDSSPQRWRAGFSYVCAIGWAAAGGTDGFVQSNALASIHGTEQTATLLTSYGLWEPRLNGWEIHNYSIRQELHAISEAKRDARQQAAYRAACVRWHGPGCWGPSGCSRNPEEGIQTRG